MVRELGHDVPRHRRARCSSCSTTASTFIDEASAHTGRDHRALLDDGLTVLQTQAGPEREHPLLLPRPGPDHRRRSRTATRTCARRCPRRPATAREVDRLLTELEPTLPVLLGQRGQRQPGGDARTSPALEQLLVIFPHVISSGFTGTPGDGYGHVNLQLDQEVQPCTQGLHAAQPVAAALGPRRRPDLSRPSAPPARRSSSAARRTRPTAGTAHRARPTGAATTRRPASSTA